MNGRRILWMFLVLPMLPAVMAEDLRWGLLSVFPKPLPLTHSAQVFPRFFSSNASLQLPFLPWDGEIAPVNDSLQLQLKGLLCFQMIQNISQNSDCIQMYNQSAAWFDMPINSSTKANATWIRGVWPASISKGNDTIPSQPRWAPFCKGTHESLLPWTGCQARKAAWAVKKYFTFSPYISTAHNGSFSGYNWTYQNPAQAVASNPFNVWLLCGVNGSCTDISPLSMLVGGGWGNVSFHWNGSIGFETSVSQLAYGLNVSFKAMPVCMWPPFVFIVYNGSYDDNVVNCSSGSCFYSLCWNTSAYSLAVVTRMPRFVPWPVQAPSAMTLFRQKRDFGITAAIVSAIAISAAAATAAAISLTSVVQTAAAVNSLSAGVAEALDLSHNLSQYITGNWSQHFDGLVRELRQSIVHINSTRVDVSLAGGLADWITTAASRLKEWAGLAGLALCLILMSVLAFWCICRMRFHQRRTQALMIQAFAAVETGQSP